MYKPRKLALISLAYLISWMLVDYAGAQQLPAKSATDSNGNSGELQEIVVSSRKRQESLLDAPVVETVVTQEQLAQSQIHDISTLAIQVPGLVLGDQIGAIGPGISIRGIGTTAENATIDQSVSLNVDGLQLSQGLAYKSALFDLGQVEVLKGPQALFFGKNSPGGVISLRSADPTDHTEIILNTGYEFEAKEKYGDVIVSGPVSDSLKLRLAAHYSNDDGYFRNLDTASPGFGTDTPPTRYYNADENWVIRGTLLFNPSELYDARLKINVDHDFTDYVGPQVANCPFAKTSFTGLPIFDPNEDCTLNRNAYLAYMNPSAFPGIRNGGVPFYLSNQKFGTLEQNVHVGELIFTSVTGIYAVDQGSVDNGSGTSGIATLSTNNDFSSRQYTEEARLASSFPQSPVNFVTGIFYQGENMTNHVRLDLNDEIPGIPLPGNFQDAIHDVHVHSISGFGQAIWKMTSQWELTAGARITHETRDHTETNYDAISGPLGPVPLLDPRLSSTNTSPEVTLSYKPVETVNIFASYKEGYKSGSFNTVTYIGPTTPSAFGDEKVRGGELGLKTRMLDGHLSMNLAGYYYRYTGLQVGANEETPSGVIAVSTLNAAAAIVKGVDFDMSYKVQGVEGLTLRTAVNYNRARYSSFPNAPCDDGQLISEGCNQLYSPLTGLYNAQNLTGRSLVRAPDWELTPSIDYTTRISTKMKLTMGAAVLYSTSYYTNLIDYNTPGFLQNAYAKVNLNLALKGLDDRWEVALIGNNVNDKITAGQCYNEPLLGAVVLGGTVAGGATRGPGGGDYPNCEAERGREVWLRFVVRPLSWVNSH